MRTLAEKAHLLNVLHQERDDVAEALSRVELLTSWQTVRRLKDRHAQLTRRIAGLERKLGPKP